MQPEQAAQSDGRTGVLHLGGLEVLSGGTNNDACTPLDNELVQWADVVMVMEREHETSSSASIARCWAESG